MTRYYPSMLLSVAVMLIIGAVYVNTPVMLTSQPMVAVIDYDIVYVRAPRYGDEQITRWPEVRSPVQHEPGSDLMLLHPDGTEEVLVDAGDGGVVDPVLSFDAKWVFYSYFPDLRDEALDVGRRFLPKQGSDIYKINLETREVVRLTNQEFTPNTAAVPWAANPSEPGEPGEAYLGYGVFNLGACPLPDGKVMFTSTRNGFLPNKDNTTINLQLFVMDDDGKNIEFVGPMNLGSALHPTVLTDGRVMFSSFESQGLRDGRLWGLWAIHPDGTSWEPLVSAFSHGNAFHFQTQLSDGELVVGHYYNLNNNGFGSLLSLPPLPPAGEAPFGSPDAKDPSNPKILQGSTEESFPFSPKGLDGVTMFTSARDAPAIKDAAGDWEGKVTHPAAAPNNDLLLVWSDGPVNLLGGDRDGGGGGGGGGDGGGRDGPGEVNPRNPDEGGRSRGRTWGLSLTETAAQQNYPTPYIDGGIYILPGGGPAASHNDLVLIKNDPNYNEMQPRPVVPYEAIYGIAEPAKLPWLPTVRSKWLSRYAPTGLVGTSSFYKRNTTPGDGFDSFDGLDPFNANGIEGVNWKTQGADAGKYDNSDIYAVRILAMEPTTQFRYGPDGIPGGWNRAFTSHSNERLRILGELPLRKTDKDGNTIYDSEGNPDTSFLAKIPADVPFTFQTLDKNGLVLNMSQTWHQVRPGEIRNNCGGCHAHAQIGLGFEGTFASTSDYRVTDLSKVTTLMDVGGAFKEKGAGAIDVEYFRDIKPILQKKCASCHTGDDAPAGLVLDDDSEVNRLDNTYNRLANDTNAKYGIKPVIGSWRMTNSSRYIRMFQSRRSLLVWKLFGERLDGWVNEDHPTESDPGNVSTLPLGAKPNDADLDYTGTIMPPPDSGVAPLTFEERLTIVRWIDLGCPISTSDKFGWFLDELKPTLMVNIGRRDIIISMNDYYSGLAMESFEVIADVMVNGIPAGMNLAYNFQQMRDGTWRWQTAFTQGTLNVSITDNQGNISSAEKTLPPLSGN